MRVHVSMAKLQNIEVQLFDKKSGFSFFENFREPYAQKKLLGEERIYVSRSVSFCFALKLRFFLSDGVEVILLRSVLPCFHSLSPLSLELP